MGQRILGLMINRQLKSGNYSKLPPLNHTTAVIQEGVNSDVLVHSLSACIAALRICCIPLFSGAHLRLHALNLDKQQTLYFNLEHSTNCTERLAYPSSIQMVIQSRNVVGRCVDLVA